MKVSFPYSHVFHGCRARVVEDGPHGQDCLVEFSDGVVVLARCKNTENGFLLSIPAYETAKGNRIGKRRWILERHGDAWRAQPA